MLAAPADCSICRMSADSTGAGSLAVAVAAMIMVCGAVEGPQALSGRQACTASSSHPMAADRRPGGPAACRRRGWYSHCLPPQEGRAASELSRCPGWSGPAAGADEGDRAGCRVQRRRR